eukprot:COSAG02_NODE_6035_length_3855_cov_112.760117_4_plen_259_part_00
MAEVAHTLSPIASEFRPPCPQQTRIDFPTPTSISHLEFRNFYAATVAVDAYFTDERVPDGVEVPWHTLVPTVELMHDPHCEGDAQRWHRLLLSRDGLPTKELLALRVTLTQPSPCWRTIRLDELRCFKRGAVAACSGTVTKTPPDRIRRMEPSATLPWHSHEDAKAVIGLLATTEQLRHSLQDVMVPQRPPSMFTLSYDEVVIGVTSEKHPSPKMDDYLHPRLSARGQADSDGASGNGAPSHNTSDDVSNDGTQERAL